MRNQDLDDRSWGKGIRVVDGKVTHLRTIFPTRESKFEHFLKEIPCVSEEEQIKLLLLGSTEMPKIKRMMELSLVMPKIAENEMNRYDNKSKLWMILHPAKVKESEKLRALYQRQSLNADEITSSWLRAFHEAKRVDPKKIPFSEESLKRRLSRISSGGALAVKRMDHYLPTPPM